MNDARAMLSTLRRRMAGQRGVTLVELMVTLMIVGILMGIAAPAINNHIALQELRAGAREVVEVLRDARDSAMNEGSPRYVQFIPPRSYRVYRFTGGAWAPETHLTPLGGSVSFTDAGVTFPLLTDVPVAGATVPENAAYFDTRGRYPFQSGAAASYAVTLLGRTGREVLLTVYRETGAVTGV